jgi:hypothetical protein
MRLLYGVVYAALVLDVLGAFAEARYIVAALTMLNALHVAVLRQRTC